MADQIAPQQRLVARHLIAARPQPGGAAASAALRHQADRAPLVGGCSMGLAGRLRRQRSGRSSRAGARPPRCPSPHRTSLPFNKLDSALGKQRRRHGLADVRIRAGRQNCLATSRRSPPTDRPARRSNRNEEQGVIGRPDGWWRAKWAGKPASSSERLRHARYAGGHRGSPGRYGSAKRRRRAGPTACRNRWASRQAHAGAEPTDLLNRSIEGGDHHRRGRRAVDERACGVEGRSIVSSHTKPPDSPSAAAGVHAGERVNSSGSSLHARSLRTVGPSSAPRRRPTGRRTAGSGAPSARAARSPRPCCTPTRRQPMRRPLSAPTQPRTPRSRCGMMRTVPRLSRNPSMMS